jgi:histidine ammonia-lyase
MADNTIGIVAIELLAAAQGVDFRAPLVSSPSLQRAMAAIRSRVPFYGEDRYFAPDIAAIKALVSSGHYTAEAAALLPSG